MGHVRRARGWSSQDEGWWFEEQDDRFKVKFTKEGEDQLFGDPRDDSELQLPAVQFATHVTASYPSNNAKKFTSILNTANDPVPSLKFLDWGRDLPVDPILDDIKSRKLSKLTFLKICWHTYADLEVKDFATAIKSGCLPFLKILKVSGCVRQGLAEGMREGHMPMLEELHISNTKMIGIQCEAFATAFSSGSLPSLTTIVLESNESIGDEGAHALGLAIKSGELKKLAVLNLEECGFGDNGLKYIADSFCAATGSCVPNLRFLNLAKNRFTDAGCSAFGDVLKNGHLNSLEILDFQGTLGEASKAAAGALVSALASNINLNAEVKFEWEKFPDLERRKDQYIERNKRYRDILAGLADSPVIQATFGKIYLCGNPEVGKTTLRQSLDRSFWKSVLTWERRPHVEPRTRGIDVSQIVSTVSKPGEMPTTLLVWDMAGQRDYHIIHNAFFPDLGSVVGKATTFVIVCSSKSTEAKSLDQLDYWLRFIASSCGKGTQNLRHVMVVLNRMKGDRKACRCASSWKQALESLKEKFKDFLNVRTDPFIVDVRRRQALQELKQRLLEHSRNLLRDEKVPEICQYLEKTLRIWSEARRQFPALEWTAFAREVRERSSDQLWLEGHLHAATRYLNEAGVLIFIDKEVFGGRKLVVLDPNWFCRDIVGNMFLHQDMVDPAEHLFRKKVDEKTGSISISEFKVFFKSFANEWADSNMEDLITILLWLGLCYQGRDGRGVENIFIPSLIADGVAPTDMWGHGEAHGNSSGCGEDQWVMGFLVEHHQSHLTLAPIALLHRFQVELAQSMRFNGRADNEFMCGKHSMSFAVDHMAILIEVTTNHDNPTFDSINIYVKPLWVDADDDLDGNDRKQYQVDLASDFVEILLKLWDEVCPGVEYLQKVVWPWPVSLSMPFQKEIWMWEKSRSALKSTTWAEKCSGGWALVQLQKISCYPAKTRIV